MGESNQALQFSVRLLVSDWPALLSPGHLVRNLHYKSAAAQCLFLWSFTPREYCLKNFQQTVDFLMAALCPNSLVASRCALALS